MRTKPAPISTYFHNSTGSWPPRPRKKQGIGFSARLYLQRGSHLLPETLVDGVAVRVVRARSMGPARRRARVRRAELPLERAHRSAMAAAGAPELVLRDSATVMTARSVSTMTSAGGSSDR